MVSNPMAAPVNASISTPVRSSVSAVTEIAIEAGFADCAHFSRQFKDAYGLSPSTRRLQPI